MKHLGDITKIHGWDIPPVDCITGGSPCQDLSLAGKRAGLDGERSGLFMEQIRLIKEMRDATRTSSLHGRGIKPRYMVWENVAGAFSSNGGKDFKAVLEETIRIAEPEAPDLPMPEKTWPHSGCIYDELGRWSVAWRLHDAQFWGVPQRRKRIALVADFGGLSATEVLFERKGLSWYSAESGEQGQGAAGDTSDSTGTAISFQERAGKPGGGKGILIQDESVCSIRTQQNQSVLAFEPGAASRLGGYCYKDKTGTLRAEPGDNAQAVCYGISSYDSNAMKSDNPNSGIYEADTSRTLDLNGGNPGCNQGGMAVCYPGVSVTCPTSGSNPQPGDPCHTLTDDSRNYVVFENHSQDTRYKPLGEVCQTVSSTFGMGGNNQPLVVNEPIVYKRGFGGHISNDGISPTVEAAMGEGGNNMPCVLESNQNHATAKYTEVCPALKAAGGEGGGHIPMIASWDGSQVSPTLTKSNANGAQRMPDKDNFNAVIETYHCTTEDEKALTLKARDYKDPQCVYGIDRAAYNQGQNAQFKPQFDNDLSASLISKGPNAVATHTVRRLTPLECERLQGFPDGWTDIGEWTDSKGKVHESSDSARYKALGNSIAVGYANKQSGFWMNLMKRISAQYERSATLGSLFDGIGGFPLAWEFYNGKGSAVWASEIEEFPIAVTKVRFGE